MLSVYQHWDKLKVCVVGKTYPPEIYSFISNSRLRNLFEKIAIETQEDLDFLEKTLQKKFNVETIRPNVPEVDCLKYIKNGERIPPPICQIPRDQMIMIGEKFFIFPFDRIASKGVMFDNVDYNESHIHALNAENLTNWWEPISNYVKENNNFIIQKKYDDLLKYIPVNGITRCGKDLIFGINDQQHLLYSLKKLQKKYFINYRCHQVPTYGHGDAVYCPVIPGLILSIMDSFSYEKLFPKWEVLYLKNESFEKIKNFETLKKLNQGKWWIKGYENDHELIDLVEYWLVDWVGYVEETVFDVNLLVVDEKNVIVSNYNKEVFKTFDRYGITPHICPLRHRYFWDGGIHCVTLDLNREGFIQDYFPERGEPSEYLSYLG